jgi:hypothetical protein
MPPNLDKHKTVFDLASKVVQNPALQTSLQSVQENGAIELPNKRKQSPSREKPDKALNHGQRSLSGSTKSDACPLLEVKYESPWNSYRKEFGCELAGDAVVVVHRKEPSKVLLLRSYTGVIGDKMQQWFSQLQHPNIMSAKESFIIKNSLYTICEDLPLTLEHLIVCHAYPTEAQLAVILRQVILSIFCKDITKR